MDLLAELERLAALHASGALTDDEFAAAKAALLGRRRADGEADSTAAADALAISRQQLEELRRANAVAQLDREWDIERESYTVTGYQGGGDVHAGRPYRYRPTRGGSVVGGVVTTVFGIIWTAGACSMSSMADGFGGTPVGGFAGLFPLFGIVFVLFGVWSSMNAYDKADSYEDAEADYQHRRAMLLAGRRDPGRQRRRPSRTASPGD